MCVCDLDGRQKWGREGERDDDTRNQVILPAYRDNRKGEDERSETRDFKLSNETPTCGERRDT